MFISSKFDILLYFVVFWYFVIAIDTLRYFLFLCGTLLDTIVAVSVVHLYVFVISFVSLWYS